MNCVHNSWDVPCVWQVIWVLIGSDQTGSNSLSQLVIIYASPGFRKLMQSDFSTELLMHWNGSVNLMKFSSLAALEVVILTISSVVSDENFVNMKTFPFQCQRQMFEWLFITVQDLRLHLLKSFLTQYYMPCSSYKVRNWSYFELTKKNPLWILYLTPMSCTRGKVIECLLWIFRRKLNRP